MTGRTMNQLIAVCEMASAPLRILYIWPERRTLQYPLQLLWWLLPSHVATFKASGPYAFETDTGASIEIVPATLNPARFLCGTDPRNIAIVIDHAVNSPEWHHEANRLAASVEAAMASRP